MIKRWMSFAPIAFAIVWGSVPLFPSFITLTSVQFPGVSVVPIGVGLTVLALMLPLAVGDTADVFRARRTTTGRTRDCTLLRVAS